MAVDILARGIASTSIKQVTVLQQQVSTIVQPVIQVKTIGELPNVGDEHFIYITQDTNMSYRWDNENVKYYSISGGGAVSDIDVIVGGNAEDIQK